MRSKKPGFVVSSLSLPVAISQDLTFVANRLGISKSALAAETLEAALSPMRVLLEQTPENPTPADVRRLRGSSRDFVKTAVAQTMELLGDEK